jgi:hypothetical protein
MIPNIFFLLGRQTCENSADSRKSAGPDLSQGVPLEIHVNSRRKNFNYWGGTPVASAASTVIMRDCLQPSVYIACTLALRAAHLQIYVIGAVGGRGIQFIQWHCSSHSAVTDDVTGSQSEACMQLSTCIELFVLKKRGGSNLEVMLWKLTYDNTIEHTIMQLNQRSCLWQGNQTWH